MKKKILSFFAAMSLAVCAILSGASSAHAKDTYDYINYETGGWCVERQGTTRWQVHLTVKWTERIRNGQWHSVRRGRALFHFYKNGKPAPFHIYHRTDYVGKKQGRVITDAASPYSARNPPTSQRISGRSDWHSARTGLSFEVQPIKLINNATTIATCNVRVYSKLPKRA